MTLLEALTKLTAGAASLEAFLEKAATNPDLKAEATEWMEKLDAAIGPEGLASLGAEIPGELLNISQGKLDGAKHPSDLA